MKCKVCNGKLNKGKIYCGKPCYYDAAKLLGNKRRVSWTLSETTRKNQSKGMKEYRKTHPMWNKNLTVKTDERIFKLGRKISKKLTGKKRPFMMGNNNPSRRPEVRKKKSKIMKKLWVNKAWAKNTIAKSINSSYRESPNKQEIKLMNIINSVLPNTYKYVGDGNLWIGRKNPDFVHTSKKKVIEFFGRRWHKLEHETDKTKYFKKFGYKCLVVWTEELKDIEALKKKILAFSK